MAAELNTAFCKVFTMENENNIPVCEPLPVNSKISSVSFSRGQVRDKIMKLKPGTAQGPDGIPARVLKDKCDSSVFLYLLFSINPWTQDASPMTGS